MDLRRILAAGDATGTGLASPLAASETVLSPAVAIAEALGLELSRLPLTREQAIQVPAVARGRNLLIGAGGPLPLVALDATGVVKRQPTFLYRSNTIENPYDRMAWTLDDLVFHGRSLWLTERGARTGGSAFGPVLDAVRCPFDRWQIRGERIEVRVDSAGPMVAVDPADVILFNAPTYGLLHDGRDTLRAAQAIERAYVDRAQNPIPLTVIRHQPGADKGDALTEAEAKDVLTVWKNARRGEGGAVGYLPPGLVLETPGTDAEALLQDARNAVRIDVANHLGIPVAMLDGGVVEESMTYRNAQGEVSRFYGDLKFWLDPIQHRLSMDDVVPRGQRVRFDLSAFDTPAPAPTGVPTED